MEDKLMTDLALSHYTKDPFEFDDTRHYYQPKDSTYGYAKPRGLWLSVDGELDWPTWCREEDWNTAYLEHKTAFRIKEYAQILLIKDFDELLEFSDRFGIRVSGPTDGVDWKAVSQVYDGIIITPYLWEGRHDGRTSFYYGYDCASGCIWNLDAIEKVADA